MATSFVPGAEPLEMLEEKVLVPRFRDLYHFAVGVILCIVEIIDCLKGLTGWWHHRR